MGKKCSIFPFAFLEEKMYHGPKKYNQNFLKRLDDKTVQLCVVLMKDRSLKEE